jgi:glycosyltransferase involved in cell wall biosynthesis
MHVAMVIDEERLRQEHTMLNRLSIGLIDQGVQITRIVPDVIEVEAVWRSEQRIALASRIEVPMRVMPWMKRSRAVRIAAQLERMPPDVLYAIGQGAWPIALDAAKVMSRPVALGVWRASLIRKAARLQSNPHVAAYIAPTEPIANELKRIVDPDLVSLVPMGVAVPSRPNHIFADSPNSIGISVIGSGRDVPAYEALLGGMSRVIKDYPAVQIILELRGPHHHDIWRIAKRLELLGAVSGIEDAAQHRTLLTCCDLMLVPERYGELTSVLLDAMASGIPIVAQDDPYLRMLVDGETALMVSPCDAQTWAERVTALLSDPQRAKAIGLAGREFIRQQHASTIQIMRLTETLEQVVGGGTYAFSEAVT